MRNILLMSITCMTSIVSEGQTVALPMNANNKVEYADVIAVDSVNAEKIFSNAKMFVTNAFKSGKDVTQLVDESAKTIVGKGTMSVVVSKGMGMTWSGYVHFTLSLFCKDNKYKYSFTDFVLHYQPGTRAPMQTNPLEDNNPQKITDKQWMNVKEQTNDVVNKMIADLKKQMASQNDW